VVVVDDIVVVVLVRVLVVVVVVSVVPPVTVGGTEIAGVGGALGWVLVGANDRQLGALHRFGHTLTNSPQSSADCDTKSAQYVAST
jgi:hypothetical protein